MKENVYENMKNLAENNWWFSIQGEIIGMFLERYLKGRDRQAILDVGCGTGRLFKTLQKYGEVWGIETHEKSAILCREMGYRDVWIGNLENTSYNDGIFDVITCIDVLEHVEKDVEGLSKCYRMLKHGGLMFITVPAGERFYGRNEQQYGHYRRYDILTLIEKITDVEFKVLETGYYNMLLLPPIVFIRKIIDILLRTSILKTYVEEIKVPFLIDMLLKYIFNLELIFLKRHRLPFGLSLLVVIEK